MLAAAWKFSIERSKERRLANALPIRFVAPHHFLGMAQEVRLCQDSKSKQPRLIGMSVEALGRHAVELFPYKVTDIL